MTQAQSLREQRFARALDREIAPVWHDRFARLIYRHLPATQDVFALDVLCGAGRSTYELLDRLGPGARVLGLESDETLRGMAKARMEAAWKDRVYFRAGDVPDLADMADDTYDLLVANLVLGEAHDAAQLIEEFMRVVKPGGRILATLPMAGTWSEVEDLFQQVLADNDGADAARRLRRLGRLRKDGPELARVAATLGVGPHDLVIEQERFTLLFNSGREFLFSPMVEHGPLRAWKAIVGDAAKQQALFWQLKEAIDVYYAESVFAVTIVAGVVVLTVPSSDPADATATAETSTRYWARYPQLDTLFGRAERGETFAEEEELDFDIDMGEEDLGAGGDRASDEAPALDADGEARLAVDDGGLDEDPMDRELESLGDLGEFDDLLVEGDEPATAAQSAAAASASNLSAEDAAIFALLDATPGEQDQDSELDALLDQVLEFANTPDARAVDATELEPEELQEIAPPADMKTKPGDTLGRIRALLPPPPGSGPQRTTDRDARRRPLTPQYGVQGRRLPPPPPPPRKNRKP